MWLTRVLLFAVMALPLAASAGESRRFAHYVHQRWIGSEAPVPVVAMAQGRDGYLWLATGDGLFRFDGIRFEQIEDENSAGKHGLPSALLVTRSGDVWTNFETSRRFAIYRNGALHVLDGITAPSRIYEMAEGPDGSIWARTASYDAELLRFHDGRWRTFNSADGLPQSNITNMIVAADGAIWVACTSAVARLAPGAARFELVGSMPKGALSQDPEGRVWISDSHGSFPITGPGGRGSPAPFRNPYRTGDEQIQLGPTFDREGNLWIATRYDGVKRIRTRGVPATDGGTGTESFTSRDGLSSDVTNQVLEDREGNIWVGTEVGLDRFRPATLIAEAALDSPAEFGDKLLGASDGSVYIGQARTIHRVRPGGMPEAILRDVVEPESLCEAPDGAIWMGFENQILVWANGSIRQTIERPDKDANHNIIYDCAFDASGDYWISAAGSGLHRYGNGHWETVLQPGHVVDFFPTTMVRTPQGGVVVQSGDRLIWVRGSAQAITHLDFGGSGLKVLTLQDAGDWVYSAGSFGLARHRPGRTETAWAPEVSLGSRINGIVQTPDGDTWLAYPKSLARFRPQELERAFSNKALPVSTLALGPGDGLVSRPHSHSQRSMVRGGDGRIWVATETGTLWMDPARLVRNLVPPSVSIRAINGDGRTFRDPTAVRLPTSTANVEIDFAVLSFADPGRVRARYMLEGFDRSWVDPGTRRQAFYTNLPPGKYRFRVLAANNDGVWNRTGGVVDFEIPPSFVQSVWFLLLCSALALASLWALYRFRVAQVAARIRSRLEERIAERERIARELHDTLLQGVQGLILRFQAVADRLSSEDKSTGHLEAALAAAEHVVVDARNRVRDLRADEVTDDLCATVEKVVAGIPFDQPLPVRVVVEGRPRPLHPLIAAEIARIVREAMLNIAYHAHASWAEIAIGFEARHLAIRMRDNGVGIPAAVLARGQKAGHFGMIGMRERAEKMGGSITISSGPDGGSEVTLAVPAKLAFAKRKPRGWPWWQRLLDRNPSDE
ncbi:histidine kinase [Lysobacter sp. S4-A87]|uniref:sensor histidine kinase n=1 Tax=Lysobacter sp. S4-A87 TaxID=2925843 RepID=UPI001F53935D|nr:sensor histidine kinase [Lysobacter sp. S4-A87]UNK47934.1 histidine kinase [Lysobacter sp. S4-A87]